MVLNPNDIIVASLAGSLAADLTVGLEAALAARDGALLAVSLAAAATLASLYYILSI